MQIIFLALATLNQHLSQRLYSQAQYVHTLHTQQYGLIISLISINTAIADRKKIVLFTTNFANTHQFMLHRVSAHEGFRLWVLQIYAECLIESEWRPYLLLYRCHLLFQFLLFDLCCEDCMHACHDATYIRLLSIIFTCRLHVRYLSNVAEMITGACCT